jgi:SAM-dependent methyltransferase
MTIDPFELLCCPACRGELDRVSSELLRCPACQFDFPVVEGIPVLFPCNVKEQMDHMFGRYWDSDEKAELYDNAVEGGDEIFGTYNHESEIYGVTALVDSDKIDVLLDAGSGNGRFLETFPQRTFKVGIDASLQLLIRTKRRGRGDFLVCGELEHLPFKDGSFGTVISCRVLQHLKQQQTAVEEMCRVTRVDGDVILELYNTWNPKTVYKNIRMSPRLRRIFNAPFRAVFRSMSPFDDWGLAYDKYNGWFQVKGWLQGANMARIRGRGVGFGFHKYLIGPFFIGAVFEKYAPNMVRRYYSAAFFAERSLGGIRPLTYWMEKFTIKATKTGSDSKESIPRRAVNKALHVFKSSAPYNLEAREEARRDKARRGSSQLTHDEHLNEAIEWLKRAQDATPDGGVSRGFGVGWVPYLDSKGWQPSYPETTGYIIPSFLDSATVLADDELRGRAVKMADWETAIQMTSGAVMGGTVDRPPTPAIFNTGQVMLGWIRALDETGDAKYRRSLDRAAAFLVSAQDADGAWRKANSKFASARTTTYNSRVGWALALCGTRLDNPQYVQAGRRNLDYTLGQQTANGWFLDNCLTDSTAPLTHTIAYAMEGLLGGYDVLKDPRYLQGVVLAARHVMASIDQNGRLPGRLDKDWRGVVEWDCLTGSAQMAGVLFRLHEITREETYHAAGKRILGFVMSTQNGETRNPGLRGGIKGSFPFDGDYGRFEVLNWATKFFVDALLLARRMHEPLKLEPMPSGQQLATITSAIQPRSA